MKLKWIGNTLDPRIARPSHMAPVNGQTHRQAFVEWQRQLEGKIIGEPKATEKYTVAELKAMNFVGLYRQDADE